MRITKLVLRMFCETTKCDVLTFLHKTINVVRLQLLEKFLDLQTEYFEDPTAFSSYQDYHKNYFEQYHVKFENCFYGLDTCKAFVNGNICACQALQVLKDLGFTELTGVRLIEIYLKEEKPLAVVFQELKEFVTSFAAGESWD